MIFNSGKLAVGVGLVGLVGLDGVPQLRNKRLNQMSLRTLDTPPVFTSRQ